MYIIITLIQTLIFGVAVPGYVTTLCAVLFLGGIIELSIGILGEYISRIYLESKHRPIFLVKDTNINSNAVISQNKDSKVKDKNIDNQNINHVKNDDLNADDETDNKCDKKSENIFNDENISDDDKVDEEETEKVEYDLSYFE